MSISFLWKSVSWAYKNLGLKYLLVWSLISYLTGVSRFEGLGINVLEVQGVVRETNFERLWLICMNLCFKTRLNSFASLAIVFIVFILTTNTPGGDSLGRVVYHVRLRGIIEGGI